MRLPGPLRDREELDVPTDDFRGFAKPTPGPPAPEACAHRLLLERDQNSLSSDPNAQQGQTFSPAQRLRLRHHCSVPVSPWAVAALSVGLPHPLPALGRQRPGGTASPGAGVEPGLSTAAPDRFRSRGLGVGIKLV